MTCVTGNGWTMYLGDCEDVLPAAERFLSSFACEQFIVFWDELTRPPVQIPLVAVHVWHRTNTNRPDNYEAIFQFASEGGRMTKAEWRALAERYCAWLNEGARLREAFADLGVEIPFPIANMWRVPLRAGPSEGEGQLIKQGTAEELAHRIAGDPS